MIGSKRILILPTDNGKPGPLDGPFTLEVDKTDEQSLQVAGAETIETIIAFIRHVTRGVSCYNKNEFENSSNLRSYATECLWDMQTDAPERAAQLESLIVDCSRLPAAMRAHPIWKLDRAIMLVLPGVTFVE